ncbi:uncharacterized protein LOC144865100 [Branchiostoma floridae x Branchiostoma japonicum]
MHTRQDLGNITRPGTIQENQYHHFKSDTTSEFQDDIKKGKTFLARADLDSAERHFAAALKTVHVKDPTAQQYQREVEPLCKLGDVYSKRGQQTGDGGDFVKAAALYNAAIARSEDQVLNGNVERHIRTVDKLFLKCILNLDCDEFQNNTEKHKKQLKEMRDQIKLEMETIDQQLDPYVHDEDDPRVKGIEAKRAQAVRHLFEKIAQQRKEFISLLVEECIGLMGPPPCKYAMIGLGSQATGLVTPYSDLEFAILVEEESDKCLVYFRNLTHYLHLKVVNLGETILPALGIKSLNDFYSEDPLDNWYYDSVTPRGFAFDGSMPKASKTPLGRQGNKNKCRSELICTPENMVSILQNDVTLYLKDGYHLATILRNPCLIAGEQYLIETYMDITGKILLAEGGKMAQQLAQETLKENNNIYKDLQLLTARLIDIKKELYRFPAVAVDCLALSSGIVPTTVWETIEEMKNKEVISPNNAHHLTVLTSISAELRLRTYIANGGQKESLSALVSTETQKHGQESSLQAIDLQTSPLKHIFYLPNEKQIFRYYYTALHLRVILSEWSEQNTTPNLFSDFYANSAAIKAMMYAELCKYSQAISCYQVALKEAEGSYTDKCRLLNDLGDALGRMGDHQGAISNLEEALTLAFSSGKSNTNPDIAMSRMNLGRAYYQSGAYGKAISYLEEALHNYRRIYGESATYAAIATLLSMLGAAYGELGEYRKAIRYLEQSLQMCRSIYGEEHINITSSLNNLGMMWKALSDFESAREYLEQALQIRRSSYGHSAAHPEIATSLRNLGMVWRSLGDCRKAISYYEQALVVDRSIYGQSTEHPDIAMSLNNLGLAWAELGEEHKAISYYEQALQMHTSVYCKNTPHPDTGRILNNLGATWASLGHHRKALNYHEQALQKRKHIYGKEHPDIATSLVSMGQTLGSLGDDREAINYYEQALEMFRGIYGQTKDQSDIAQTLSSLGNAWHSLGDYQTAVRYHKEALQMSKSIYGQNKAHPHIAETLNDLGTAYDYLADYSEAISCHEHALEMNRTIYGQSIAHPKVVTSLSRLGSVWYHQGDQRKAISFSEQALQMCRSIYGQDTAHPQIAMKLNDLGETCRKLGDYSKAFSYLEQALRMFRCIYGEGTAHPLTATSLMNLGSVCHHLREYRKAISYYEEALQMYKSIYGQTTAHPEIAKSLNNLGQAYNDLHDHSKAISYLKQALQMAESIYGQGSAHPDIATIQHNLGLAWSNIGDHKRAT